MYYQPQTSSLNQQQNTTTATSWNGKAWVQSTAAKTNPFSSLTTYSNQAAPATASSGILPSMFSNTSVATTNQSSPPLTIQQQQQAITQYTEYHKHWLAQAQSQRVKANNKMPGPEKEELIRHAAWAEHYATLSTQAIQYYNSLSSGSAVNTGVVQSQPLSASTKEAKHTAGQKQPSMPNKAQHNTTVAGFASLKLFNQRALSQCTTAEQNGEMQKLVNKVISDAKKKKTLFSTDWSTFPIPNLVVDKSKLKVCKSQSESSCGRPSFSPYSQQYNKSLKSPKQQSKADRKRSTSSSYSGEFPPLKKFNNNLSEYASPKNKEQLDVQLEEDYISLNTGRHNLKENNNKKSSRKDAKKTSTPKNAKYKNTLGCSSGFLKSSNVLNRRASRFSDNLCPEESSALEKFGQYMGTSVIGGQRIFDESDYEYMTVKGVCMKLEKEYLRLTAPPIAGAVRPQHILERHLENIKSLWSNNQTRCEYDWLCSQFKAIRQDLTVQRINNSFSVDVYETHARIALEKADLNEYNQCQTQLKELYETLERQGITDVLKHQNEFIAYRIIYYVFLTGFNKKYEGGSTDLFKIMLRLSASQKEDPIIMFALKVADNDYHAFFRLHYESPLMCAYLMDFMVPTMRLFGLQRICRAYRPTISIHFVLSELGFLPSDFNDNSETMTEQGTKWIESCGCKINKNNNSELLTIESEVCAPSGTEANKNSLI